MKRSGGFRFARKAVTVRRWILRRRGRINGLPLKGFLRRLTLLFDYKGDRADAVPRGHLAIHVGQPGQETCRVIVPVACINHSLFQELLDRVEDVYGYYHPGAINLPCSLSEYEAVRRSIAASENPDRAVLEQKKKMFKLSYLRNSFSKMLVHTISEY